MFDVETYFAQIETRLKACRGQTVCLDVEGPHIKRDRNGRWIGATLNIDIEWATGEILSVGDYWSNKDKFALHEFSYHFMRADNSLIFRLSSHGRTIKHGFPSHVHVGEPQQTIEDGDPRLHGYRLVSITLIEALELIQVYALGNRLPWEP